MRSKTILFVDDEQNILRAFRRLFMESEQNILLANSAEEALDILKQETVDLIISDMRMPYMDGYELLSRVRQQYPHVARIILSGFAEKDTMIQFIQDNLAVIYLLKPWENEQLLRTVNSILRLHQILKDNNMDEVADSLADTVNVRQVVCDKILVQLEKGMELDSIAELIEEDFILSAIILRHVNSMFYGSSIASIKQALNYLNANELKNIVQSKKLNHSIDGDGSVSGLKKFLWKQAGLRNKITHFIYRNIIGKEVPEEYRLAGLLCNIGMVVLLKIYKEEYVDLVNVSWSKALNLSKQEKEKYGINHHEVGRYLLDWWGIPYPILEATLYHHNPQNPEIIHKELLNIIYIASYYTWILLGEKPLEACNDVIYSSIGITKARCESIIFDNFYMEKN